jgi:superfamily I DNA/RNA helicase
MELTKEQIAVIKTDFPKVVVNATVGSGKTYVIAERVRYLIENNTNPEDIVIVTYTNYAAEVVRKRIENNNVTICTIHKLAARVLGKNGIDPTQFIDNEQFDDLLFAAIPLAFTYEIGYLFVDEYQDTGDRENEFIMNLNYHNIFVVGDLLQSIYGFKGCSGQYFLNLTRSFQWKMYNLPMNFRCGKNIYNAAKNLIPKMKHKFYRPDICGTSLNGEVKYCKLADIIHSLSILNEGFNKWFILCRTNSQIAAVKTLLDSLLIPNDTFKKGRDFSYDDITDLMEKDSVKILTVHAAKGLENDNVICYGLWDSTDEEKRITYVAYTRAKKKLYICEDTAQKGSYTKKKKIAETNEPLVKW